MSDFVISGGIRFDPKDIDTSAITKAITNAAASASITLGKISLSKDIKNQIEGMLSDIQLRLSDKNISLGISSKIGNQIAAIIQESVTAKPLKLQINPEYLRNQIEAAIKSMGNINVQIGASPRPGGGRGGVGAAVAGGAGGGKAGGGFDIDKEIAKREAAIAKQIAIEERRLLSGEVDLAVLQKINAEHKTQQVNAQLGVTEQSKYLERLKKATDLQSLIDNEKEAELKLLKYLNAEQQRELLAKKKAALGITGPAAPTPAEVTAARTAKTAGMAAVPVTPEEVAAKVAAAQRAAELKTQVAAALPPKPVKAPPPPVEPGDALRKQTADMEKLIATTTSAERAQNSFNKLLLQGAGSAETFGAKIGQITTRFTAYLVSLKAIFAVQQAFSASLKFIFEYDSALVEVQKIIQMLPGDLQTLSGQLFGVANATGKSILQVTESFNGFIRAGVGVEEAIRRTEAAMIAMNATGLDVAESTQLITSALTVYKNEIKTGIEAIDALTVADTMSAASASEIARAFLRSGGAAEAIGVSYKELTAIISGTIEASQLSGSTIGAALKTIFANLASNSEQLRKTANAWGANILAGEDLYVVLQKLSAIYPSLNKEQVAQINQIIAGKRRFTELSAILGNFGKIQQIVAAEMGGAGTAMQRNELELSKLSTQVQIAKNQFFEFVSNLSGVSRGGEGLGSLRDTMSGLIGIFGGVFGTVNKINAELQKEGGYLKEITNIVGSGLTAAFKVALFTYGLQAIRGIVSGFKQFISAATGIGTAVTQLSTNMKNVGTQTGIAAKNMDGLSTSTQKATTLAKELESIMTRMSGKVPGAKGKGKVTIAGNLEPDQGLLAKAAKAIPTFKAMGTMAGLTAVQAASDIFAERAKKAGEAGDQLATSLYGAGSSAASMGVMFTAMAGPIAGVIAGLTTFGVQLAISALNIAAANKAYLDAVTKEAGKVMGVGDAYVRGGEMAVEAFRDAAGGATKLAGKQISAATWIERMQARFGAASDGLVQSTSKLSDEFRNTTVGTQRAAEITQKIEKAGAEFARKASSIKLEIGLKGPVMQEFQAVQEQIVSAGSAFENIKYDAAKIGSSFNQVEASAALIDDSLHNTQDTSAKIVANWGFSTTTLDDINEKIRIGKVKLEEARKEQSKLASTGDEYTLALEDEKAALTKILEITAKARKEGTANAQQIEEEPKQRKLLEGIEAKLSSNAKTREQIDKNILEMGGQLNELEAQRETESKRIVDALVDQKVAYEGIAKAAALIPIQMQQQTKNLQDQMPFLNKQLEGQLAIANATLKGGTLAERSAAKEMAGQQSIQQQVDKLNIERANAIDILKKKQAQAAKDGYTEQAKSIQKTIAEMEKEGPILAAALKQKLETELNITRIQVKQEEIMKAEEALRNVRMRNAQMVVEEEMRVSQRRIDLIKKFGETAAGRKYLEKEYRPSQYAERNFGLVGAILIEEFTKSAQLATQGAVAELDMMRINGSKSLADLRKAMDDVSIAEEELADARKKGASAAEIKTAEAKLAGAEGALKKVKEGAVDAFEQVQKAQEIQALALQKNEELKAQIQEQVLARVQDSIDNVNSAEERLIAIRNKIPEANAKVIESERAYGEASGEVNKATEDLMKAYQELADAQYGLAADIAMAEFSARQSVGAFSGAADAIGFLRSKWGEINSTVKASTQAQLELRRRMAQEEMNILKTQFDALKSLGQRAATAGPEEIAKMREQFAAAQAIAAGRATPAEFDPEILQGLDAFASLVPGLEKALTSFGLEQLGINPSVLDQMGQDIIGLSEATADGGKAQVDQAVEQVKLAQENLNKAEEQKQVALQNLQVSVQQRDAILAQAGNAQMAVNLAQAQLNEQMFSASQQLKILEEDKWANEQLMALYNKAVEVEQQAVNEITLLRESSLAKLEELKTAVVAAVAASKSSSPTTAPTAARGTLTMSEFNSLYGAARRESRAMPPGARLMMANTSETVLTRRQSKMMGLAPKVVPNAQAGNAAIDPTALTAALTSALKNAMATTPVQQNVTIQLDQAKTIDVRGLDGIDSAMRSAFEERAGRFADADEQKAIADIVKSMVGKLSELGVNNSLGY